MSFFLASDLDVSNAYVQLIIASLILVLSHFFNIISKKTNIPSVLLLIGTGILLKLAADAMGFDDLDLYGVLELLGIVGLIMIVLEAALDLEITQEKLPVIYQSLAIAFICLMASSFGIAYIIYYFIGGIGFGTSLLYAIPLSIMSSAIIIPSVSSLLQSKKEFMIYESAFSDILGIMFFYFIISFLESGGRSAFMEFIASLFLTVIISVLASYALMYVFKDMKGHTRLFLLIAILLILYGVGKLLHLSPLLIILIFGLALANHEFVFKVFRTDAVKRKDDPINNIVKDFHLITLETAFVVRTYFFVIFGMTIALASLVNLQVAFVSAAILIAMYLIRFFSLYPFLKNNILPELWIAPRGLITILLFFAIPTQFITERFDNGILLYVILVSSLIMTFALIANKSGAGNVEDSSSSGH